MSPRGKRMLKVIVAAEVTTVAIVFSILAFLARGRSGPAGGGNANLAAPAPAPLPPVPPPVPVIPEGNVSHPPTPPTPTHPAPPPDTTPVLTPVTGPAATQNSLSAKEAQQALQSGRSLLAAGRPLDARSTLSQAVFSGRLGAAEEAQAVAAATEAADKTLFARQLIEGDSYNVPYAVKPNQTLEGARGIEMTERLHVPARMLLKVNGLARGADLRPGQTIKLLRGPFHAVVYKGRFVMDLYLQRDELERVFVRRIPVGLGMNSSTPTGAWRAQQGQKLERPPYNATPASGLPVGTKVLYGQPGYPFGAKALWIGLEGTEPKTTGIPDFGIHSTSDPASIGKANSLGCVRMADGDIDLVFSLLYEVHSRVDVVP